MAAVFVYGSLKRGFIHHGELAGARYIRKVETTRGYRLVRVEGYPALVAGRGRVAGELYEVDASLLAHLDRFEDCPALYQRETIDLADGSSAFAYLMSSPAAAACPEIEGGRWDERR